MGEEEMRINSIEIEVLDPKAGRLESTSKTSYKNGHKPQVLVGRGIWHHTDVLKVLTEKLTDDRRTHVLVTIRTSQGVYKHFMEHTGVQA